MHSPVVWLHASVPVVLQRQSCREREGILKVSPMESINTLALWGNWNLYRICPLKISTYNVLITELVCKFTCAAHYTSPTMHASLGSPKLFTSQRSQVLPVVSGGQGHCPVAILQFSSGLEQPQSVSRETHIIQEP